ncbi:hypothetical protein [Brenneria tiliae]|uniref:Uncharacterized protein n=1 Tax=Brenneria tiliae TaxID=2914984 RepID=A0ABT0MQG0_9GAMM|nr:hypothetical protein [Brenneria tiliae]MCL2892086.1 hypothetical protein [Brenneria tiliae]
MLFQPPAAELKLRAGWTAFSGGLPRQNGITQSAVTPAVIEIRDGSAQRQDIAQLSRDTAGANDSVNDGFDRQKVEDKLAIQKEATALDAYKTYKKSEAVAGQDAPDAGRRERRRDKGADTKQRRGAGGRA